MSTPRRRAPRAGIVDAATKLFSEKGYAQTTMSDVARASGLQQSSLYYWFRSKEQLLQETLAVNRASLDFIAEVGPGSGSPALKLYRLLRFDAMQLALSPMDFNEIERIAHQQRADFHQFWRDYERLTQWVVDLIGAGVGEGKFVDCDKAQTAELLLSFGEGAQKRARLTAEAGDRVAAAVRIGEQVATLSLRGLLKRPGDVERLRTQAAAFDDVAVAMRGAGPADDD
ncbi:TetR/AcrR family transcriptional regulator [Mycobacterium yunnanensis]|uniref:TetR/AcrR family transcriptional regulator n=1 Tax=Mycobacterium yunnanensis TaxID=368477 RepID=A0A9X3BVV3_9MYCO|nr:TetR/AcrR family transcriptional regulator [Mycobacterium yunnanensis]MCV7424084.1 TetR/AcrR family transcriptional regulator [Mycobacterium yunnanensis]